jgi:hypothetical protein
MVLLAVPPDNTISASLAGFAAPWCGGSGARLGAAAPNDNGQPDRNIDHHHRDDDLHRTDPLNCQRQLRQTGSGARSRPWPWPDRAKSRLEPSPASFTYRRVLQLLSQPAVEVRRVRPGRQAREDGAPPCWPAASPATKTSWPSGNRPIRGAGLRDCPTCARVTGTRRGCFRAASGSMRPTIR